MNVVTAWTTWVTGPLPQHCTILSVVLVGVPPHRDLDLVRPRARRCPSARRALDSALLVQLPWSSRMARWRLACSDCSRRVLQLTSQGATLCRLLLVPDLLELETTTLRVCSAHLPRNSALRRGSVLRESIDQVMYRRLGLASLGDLRLPGCRPDLLHGPGHHSALWSAQKELPRDNAEVQHCQDVLVLAAVQEVVRLTHRYRCGEEWVICECSQSDAFPAMQGTHQSRKGRGGRRGGGVALCFMICSSVGRARPLRTRVCTASCAASASSTVMGMDSVRNLLAPAPTREPVITIPPSSGTAPALEHGILSVRNRQTIVSAS